MAERSVALGLLVEDILGLFIVDMYVFIFWGDKCCVHEIMRAESPG